MASANALGVLVPIAVGGAAVAGLRSAARVDWKAVLIDFATGPGRTSRLLLAVFMVLNWKNMPFMWTYRVWGAIVRQYLPFLRPAPGALVPRHLFRYAVTTSYASLLETDYNLHKSNSTYFADLDVSRSHCVSHLLKPGMQALGANETVTRCVRDKEGKVVKGGMGIGLGAVFCSFKKEVAPLQGYEMWTRILAWDRKWVYLLTHFVVKGKVHGASTKGEPLDKYVIATAVSKYVFKVGRFTVHPAIVLGQSGLLPDGRPGGWRYGPDEVGDEGEDLGLLGVPGDGDADWTWQRVEHQRREGMKLAAQFAGLEGLHSLFDGGASQGGSGVLGRFSPG